MIKSDATYTGSSTNLKNRIIAHNNGQSKHTAKFKPWDLLWAGIFSTKEKAEKFE
jgi:putative endonuclease